MHTPGILLAQHAVLDFLEPDVDRDGTNDVWLDFCIGRSSGIDHTTIDPSHADVKLALS